MLLADAGLGPEQPGERGATHEPGADTAVSGPVQVDDVDQLRAGRGVALDECDRIRTTIGHVREVPAPESNGLRAEQVDGRDYMERRFGLALLC